MKSKMIGDENPRRTDLVHHFFGKNDAPLPIAAAEPDPAEPRR